MDQDIIKQRVNDWYHTYSNDIYKYVFFMIGEHDQAKDILQDTFLRAYHNFESFQGEKVKNWLFRIARNLTIDYIRKKKTIACLIDSISSSKVTNKTPEQTIVLNETERELYDALRKIKRSYREVIVLRKIKEFSVSESCHILGWNENKVKVNLHRGMKALRKQLVKEGYRHETI
ncbi:RNA polymerase sigma factor [Alteribacillus sp. YIM 98480]|uniref:RNA polymerase sigma factor n=1 Tax=Alteribacillus sp. YIM 98480 TaxID=2606599 RepID=UPI001E479691|nr:RNA polymerase sigma factor [Alteribacillus sp. YIM 98480]